MYNAIMLRAGNPWLHAQCPYEERTPRSKGIDRKGLSIRRPLPCCPRTLPAI